MRQIRIKRLIHRANYRGFKEADLILGGFARQYAPAFTDIELDQYEALLQEKDHDIYDWISGAVAVPSQYNTPLFAKICSYSPLP